MLLSKETRKGLQITVMNVIIKSVIIMFFFKNSQFICGTSQVLLQHSWSKSIFKPKLCQDPLENFFGHQRQRGRGHDNPNVEQFIINTQALRVINGISNKIKGNCRGQKVEETNEDIGPLPKRRYCHE